MERQCVYCGVRTENGKTIYTKLMVERVEKIHTRVKVKVMFTLEQTTKAQRGSRGIALLFL